MDHMKQESQPAKNEQPSREVRREMCQKCSGFGWASFLGGLGLGVAVGGILVFLLFEKPVRVVVEIEPKGLSSQTAPDVISSNLRAAVKREGRAESFEQEVGSGANLHAYKSTCLMEVKPMMPDAQHIPMTRGFMNTQFEIIMAPTTLELAMDKIQLEKRWGKDRQSVLNILRKIVKVNQRRGTDLIEITVVHQDKVEAQMICEALHQAYSQRRSDLELGLRKEQLKAIKVVLQNKSDRVAELRKRLMDIAEKSGVIYTEAKQGGGSIGMNRGLLEMAEKELYQAERDKKQLHLKAAKLIPLDRDELIAVVADQPDAALKKSYQKYVVAKRELQAELAKGVEKDHPDIAARKAEIGELKVALEKQAVGYREKLQHQLVLLEARVKKMREVIESNQGKNPRRNRDIQEFNVARKEYQTASSIKEAMQKKYDLEKTEMIMPTTNIIVHDLSTVQVKRRK